MTVKEMVVDVRAQLQRIAANKSRKLQDDQIDWFLNSTQQMMIETSIKSVLGSSRYQIKENRYENISGLIVNLYQMQAIWDGEKYMSILPPDFWYLLDDGSRVSQLCIGDTMSIGYEVLNITRVPFPFSPQTTGCYNDVQLLYNNATVFNLRSLLNTRQKFNWSGLPSTDAHFYIRSLMVQELAKIGIKAYWEQFYTFDYPYHLIFAYPGTSVPITLLMDGGTYNSTSEELTTAIHSNSRTKILAPNTMISSDKEFSSNTTPYFKTSYISPISQKGPAIIYTHADNSFIVCNTVVNYIRKPAVISLSLGTDCELSPRVHQQLCNKTTEVILNRLDDPDWKEITQQNTINEK